jgi:putative tricarboxylic transport membrane protein
LIAPPLANFALRFGPPEYTALLVLGLVFLAYMSSTSLPRTLLMACVGLMLGTIGIDNMTGHFRYSFDIPELGDGSASSRSRSACSAWARSCRHRPPT